MLHTDSLTGQFLIAMPNLVDPNFQRSVTYLCEHTDQGALGLVVNQPTDIILGELLEQLAITPDREHTRAVPLYLGGPVHPEQCLVLHYPVGNWQHTLPVGQGTGLTGSLDILHAIAAGNGPEQYLVCLGYAGWAPGQLEEELLDNAWITGPADRDILFEIPVEDRWLAAATRLGVDLHLMASDVGHA